MPKMIGCRGYFGGAERAALYVCRFTDDGKCSIRRDFGCRLCTFCTTTALYIRFPALFLIKNRWEVCTWSNCFDALSTTRAFHNKSS